MSRPATTMRVDLLRRRVHWWHARARLHRSRGRHVTAVQVMQRHAGHLDEAIACYTRALPLLEKALGERHPTVMTCRDNLAALATHQREPDRGPVQP
jgi:hypothetical protein